MKGSAVMQAISASGRQRNRRRRGRHARCKRGRSPAFGRAETFGRIETPDSLKQSLPPQNFVTAGDAAVKIVGDVEECAVAVGDAGIECQEIRWHRVLVTRGAAHLELLDRLCSPYRPVAEQTAAEIGTRGDALVAQIERQREVEQDMVVIAGIERDAIERARGGYTGNDDHILLDLTLPF